MAKGPGLWAGKKLHKARLGYAKSEMDKVASGQSLISDEERRAAEESATSAAQQGINAMQQVTNRMAMAQSGGAPLGAGALQAAAGQIGGAGADAVTAASVQSQRALDQLNEARKANALAMAQQLDNEQAKKRKERTEAAQETVEAGMGKFMQTGDPIEAAAAAAVPALSILGI